MAEAGVPKRFPDWKKVFVAILEKQVETVLGEDAIREIKQPHLQKELSERLFDIYDKAERLFIEQCPDRAVGEIVLNLPLATLPSLQQAFADFLRQPVPERLESMLAAQMKQDHPDLSDAQIGGAVQLYVRILQSELVPLSKDFRQMMQTYSLEQIKDATQSMSQLLSKLVDLFSSSSSSSISDTNGSGIRYNPHLPNYKCYSWLSFTSFRFLESLDSVRFNEITNACEMRMLNGKSELLEALLFGDAIALSENQLIDSRGAVECLSELIQGARKAKVRIPIRLACLNPNQGVFLLSSQRIGNIDPDQLDKRYMLSANPNLDMDVVRRKLWAESLANGVQGLDRILQESSLAEQEFACNLFTTLDYIDREGGFLIGAMNIPDRFSREIKQVLRLTDGDLQDMCRQERDAGIPEIMHPNWFENASEASAAGQLVAGLQEIVDRLGGVPKSRSPIYTELVRLEQIDARLVEGIREIVDSVYNHVMGLAVSADSLSDTTGGDTQNILVQAGHALAQWARQTEKQENGCTFELPWAWGGKSRLFWSSEVKLTDVHQLIKQVPWEAILEAMKEPRWVKSLANYRIAAEYLQSIDRTSIILGSMGKPWRQKHRDAHKALDEAWRQHIDISARLISNQVWKLGVDGIRYYLPENAKRPIDVVQVYRTMGTAADYSVEMPLFESNVVQRYAFDQSIQGMVNEIAQKRLH